MNATLIVALTSATTFAATSIDDLILLTFFFAQGISPRKIVAGQYAGFGAIIVATLIAINFALPLPAGWMRLLGLLPVLIGVKHLFRAAKVERSQGGGRNPGVGLIAFLIFSNGADNIGVYLPFFLIARGHLPVVLAVYGVLIATWCLVAKSLGTRPAILRQLNQRAHWIMPAVLIALGVYILIS